MEYPGSMLKKPIRKALVIIFITAFCVLAPAIIMYTSGYRYDWKKGILKETGAINIDIEPKIASVVINNIPIKSKIPIRLNERIPGKYQLFISAPGYFDWNKEIEVKNKQTVYIKEISLLQKNQPTLLIEGNYSDISISPDSNFLAYIKNNEKIQDINIYNLNIKEEINLTEFDINTEYKISWAFNNNYLAISEKIPPYNNLLIYNADNPSKEHDLMALTRYPIDKYQWKESIQPEIYYSTNLRLISFIPTTEQRYILAKNNWLDWFMENGQLWTLQLNSSTSQISLVRDTLGFSEIFAPENSFESTEQDTQIIGAINNYAILKKRDKSEMILLSKNNKFNIAGEKFIISPYDNWLIIWTPWEIWTFAKNDAEPNLLTRSGEGLNQIATLDKFNTLALIWSDKTTALFPYYLVTHDLINAKIESIAVNTKKHIIYFSAEIDGKKGIWQLSY